MEKKIDALAPERVNSMLLDEYRQLVDTLFAEKSSILIPNCNIEHAKIINQLIVKHAPQAGNVYFFSQKFSKECFEAPAFLEEVKKAIQREVHFHLACTDACEAGEFLKVLSLDPTHPYANPLHQIKEHAKKLMYGNKSAINFSTNETAVRFERDENFPKASVSANDPNAAKILISFFNMACAEA